MQNRLSAPLGLLVLLIACSAPPGGGEAAMGTAEDEQAVRSLADKYAAAYTAKDTAMLGATVADEYQSVDPTGKLINGRSAAVAAAAQEFAMIPAGMSMSMTATTDFVKWMDATHAVAGGTWTVSPAMPGVPSKGSWMGAAVKQGSDWKMISALGAPDMTGMMPPPPAPAAKP